MVNISQFFSQRTKIRSTRNLKKKFLSFLFSCQLIKFTNKMSCGIKPSMSFGRRRSKKKSSPTKRRSPKCLSFKSRMLRRHSRMSRRSRGSRGSRGSRSYLRRMMSYLPFMKSKRRYRFGKAGDGMGGMGPGYPGPTSFQNGYAPYFGGKEPFINASEWYYPNPSGVPNLAPNNKPTYYQSPQMISMYEGNGYGKRNKRCTRCTRNKRCKRCTR